MHERTSQFVYIYNIYYYIINNYIYYYIIYISIYIYIGYVLVLAYFFLVSLHMKS